MDDISIFLVQIWEVFFLYYQFYTLQGRERIIFPLFIALTGGALANKVRRSQARCVLSSPHAGSPSVTGACFSLECFYRGLV